MNLEITDLPNENTENLEKIPKKVFIVPDRNRVQQKFFFSKYMSFILENEEDYEIYFSHQCDTRNFNRGATKNIGFIAMKQKYPNDYKNITFIFNDVDTIPFTKIFDYETTPGVVKHYYGFTYTLGGIVVIKGGDFERINGYPNFWGWGNEDNCLQKRCEKNGIFIDRSIFYQIGSPEILQLFDGISRIISKRDPWRMKYDNGVDGIFTIKKLFYTIDYESKNPKDNVFVVENDNIKIINIMSFLADLRHEEDDYYSYDLREPPRKIINPNKLPKTNKTIVNTDDWRNIPYYPTAEEAKQMSLANGNVNSQSNYDDMSEKKLREYSKQMEKEIKIEQQSKMLNFPELRSQMKTQLEEYRNSKQQIMNQSGSSLPPPPHIFSPKYANYIGVKPLATPSARIGLGGLY